MTLFFAKHRIPDAAADNDFRDLLRNTVTENGGALTGSFLRSLDTLYPRNVCLQRNALGKEALLEGLKLLGNVKGVYINMCLDSTTKWDIPFVGLVFQRVTHTDNNVQDKSIEPVVSLSSDSPRVLAMLRSDVDSQLEIANFASCAIDFIENKLEGKCASVIHDGNRAETNAFRFQGQDNLKDVHQRKSDLPFDLLCVLHLIQLSFSRVKETYKHLKAALKNLRVRVFGQRAFRQLSDFRTTFGLSDNESGFQTTVQTRHSDNAG